MSRARVLAVDDQRYFRDLIEGLLGDEGYEVRTASSGAEALHVLEREEFDVVVSDLVMPGMDGAALVQRIKERLPDQEIVMVTGVVDVKSAVEAMKLGATDYIVKPFDRSHLLDSLERILQRRRLRDEHARLIGENLEIMGALSLYERAAGLFSTLSIEALSERVIEGLCLETGAQGGVLWVADAVDDPQIVLQSARGLIRLDEESKQFDFAQLGDECRAELLEGRAVVRPLTRGNASSEALYVPLRRAGALLGIARLSDKLDADGFDERDRTAAAKFAGFGAVAVVNALEFRALERRSLRDPTTRAYTLAYLHDAVRHEIQKGSRFGHRFSLIRADLDGTGDLRRGRSEAEFAHWLESLARQMGGTLRATDLLATASASSHRMLLPQTDALGSAVLENRLREVIEAALAESARDGEPVPRLTIASATYPTDGTQLDTLEAVVEARLEENRQSLFEAAGRGVDSFAAMLETLAERADPEPVEMAGQITRFALDDLGRRPADRGLLFLSPAGGLAPDLLERIERLAVGSSRTELVIVGEKCAALDPAAHVTWVSPQAVGTDRPFLLYYGDAPAYAMSTAHADTGAGPGLFHTNDRLLVGRLFFQLQRDLGLPQSA